MSKDSKDKADQQALEDAKAQAGDALNQTIVTGRRIVIDPETGQVRLDDSSSANEGEETAEIALDASEVAEGESDGDTAPEETAEEPDEDDESTAQNAAPEVPEAVMDKTQAQPIPPELSEKLSGAAVELGEQTMIKANKRLSAETLFAFALPEPVLNKAMQDAEKQQGKEDDSESASGLGLKIGLSLLSLALLGGGGAYWYLGAGSASKPSAALTQKSTETEEAASEEKKAAELQPETKEVEKFEGPITAENVGTLTNGQLASALDSGDVKTISQVIVEASQRDDQSLVEKVVALGKADDYLLRVTAVKAFAEEGAYTKKTSDAVLAMLLERLDDEDELVRGFAAKAIGASGDSTALTKLRGRLDLEESDVVVKMIRAAIVEIGK